MYIFICSSTRKVTLMNQNTSNSSERFLRAYKIAIPIFLVLAVITAAGFFLAMRNDFNSVIGHFAGGSAGYTLTVISLAASVILAFAVLLSARKSASVIRDIDENPVTLFGAVLTALMSIAYLFSSAADMMTGAGLSKPALAAAVLTPFIGISMILSLIRGLRSSPIRQISAIAAAVAVNCSMFADYFDFTLPLNSPIRNLVTVAKAASLLYLLSEARIAFGQKSGRIALPYAVFSSALAASVTLGYSCGALLTSAISPMPSDPNPPVIHLALYAAIGIHAAGRMITLLPAIGEYVEPPKEEKKKK